MKPRKTWILIADGGCARIVEHRGPGLGLSPMPDRNWQASKPQEFADRPGRSFNRMHAARHKMEPSNKAVSDQDRFANTLLADLADCHVNGLFEDLILCAAPSMLGSLRKQMPDALKSAIRAEVAKDLKDVRVRDLAPHFEDVLAV
ncbi:host attachment protein [Hoeflea sp. TYP-13]|uniref:host attachment protein n=1 Tax=Hoeflea sp. TYP-13 TaxID=3230023 RepID=UPI0034C622E5